MAQDNEWDRLKQSARESALLLLKVVAGVVTVSVIVGGTGWLIISGKDLLFRHYQNHAQIMRYGGCALAWLCILVGNFVWLTYRRFEKIQGREPAGKYGYLMLCIMSATFGAELLLIGIIVRMLFYGDGPGGADVSVMSLTVLTLVISVGIKMPDSGRN
ncbi:hypothetical protein PUW30_22935 (plasmid) [Salmonella enterica subsp. enterica serovar Gallinarum]|uniref:hypothetical protein n=1 Tax=Salmonella enterica TaxID=28901 RepID=UPI0002D3497E|nr:hypothetical protein [Salmonella enterica]EAA9434410.1 hypothetical protein [Salmonella enterica subsp. enterica serovar Gallinarum]EBH8918434.1 hypothetical protein [Salmonella enterica subsp. enterica serovar Gallinarum]EBH8974271.1 hypothetical protein [Salmonella enterica subsp. enterica serovar Gallinarum]EBH8995704.1 hypothetical protein [Salmonella enterica subsp. enterica serovar Gallinarum]EBH9018069.1 hypothetical protein [Salmonella enterica subsp. enterica serovar Gallinarum]